MTTQTARGLFRYPEPADNSNNVRLDIQRLAEDIAARGGLFVQSTAALRPAAGALGTFHYATDTGALTYDTGTAWVSASGVSKAGGDTITASAAGVIPLVVKGAASQTANLLEARDSASNIVARVNSGGALRIGSGGVAATETGFVNIQTVAASQGLVVRGAASQSANLAEFQNSAGTVLARVGADGTFRHLNDAGTVTLQSFDADGAYLSVATATHKPLLVRGAASQSANLAEFQNSAGTVLSRFDNIGRLEIGGVDLLTTIDAGFSLVTRSATSRGLLVRGAASQSANLAEFQNSAGVVLAGVTAAGGLDLPASANTEAFRFPAFGSGVGLVNTSATGPYAGRVAVSVNGVRYWLQVFN